jgi:long-chain acyl-CoA synthetase
MPPTVWSSRDLERHGLRPPFNRRPMPEGPADVATFLDRSLRERPDDVALVGRTARLTYRELDRRVNAAVAFLSELGVRPPDRVAASAGNDTDIVVAFLAVLRLGGIWVGINRNYAPQEKRYQLEDSGAVIFLGDRKAAAEVAGLSESPSALRHIVVMDSADVACAWNRGLEAHRSSARL